MSGSPVPVSVPDAIEKRIQLAAPKSRVWRAISDAQAFGTWFGVQFDGSFQAGSRIRGRIVPTQVDAEVAKLQEPHSGTPFEIWIERIEPEQLFSFRWHPYALDKDADYENEPTTLVTFTLTDAPSGTLLTLTESGFSKIPLGRRIEAFTSNEGGWTHQAKLLQKYLERHG